QTASRITEFTDIAELGINASDVLLEGLRKAAPFSSEDPVAGMTDLAQRPGLHDLLPGRRRIPLAEEQCEFRTAQRAGSDIDQREAGETEVVAALCQNPVDLEIAGREIARRGEVRGADGRSRQICSSEWAGTDHEVLVELGAANDLAEG